MGIPYIGEIRLFAGNFAPAGWMFCEGQLLQISEFDALFNLIGTVYGGDGQETFALPDLRGRIPIHQGNGYVVGQRDGVETVTLSVMHIPAHSHVPMAKAAAGTQPGPGGATWAASTLRKYTTEPPTVDMNIQAAGTHVGGQPHDNMMPYTTLNFIISLFGVFPSQT